MTPNQLSTLNFQNSLVANGLSRPDKMQLVYDLSGGYNVLTLLVDKLNKNRSRQVVGQDGKIEKALFGRTNIITGVASSTAVGSNIRVTFTDPNYNLFTLKKVVLDSNRNQGRVIQKGPGYIVLEPTPATPTFSTSTMFTSTMYAKAAWDASGNFGSTNPEPIYQVPYYDYNYTSVMRGSAQYFRRNENSTWVEYKGKYWYTSIDQMAVDFYAKDLERKSWFSVRGQTVNSNIEGTVNYNGGLIWAIKDPIRGGVVRSLSNNPTFSDINNFAMAIARRQAVGETRQTWLIGQGALANIQTNMTLPFVQYSGDRNTFGGEAVKGLDVRTISIAGTTVDLIPCPFFNDEEYFPEMSSIPGVIGTKMSNTIVALDTGMYPAIGGGMLPSIERIHFGSQEMCYGYQNGIGMNAPTSPIIPAAGQSWGQIVSDRDSMEFSIYGDGGIDAMAYRMGILELAS